MIFEFDPGKSSSNAAKHGIDFIKAQALWADQNLLEAPARITGEARWIAIGRIGDTVWAAIFTKRDRATRILSVRRARREERQFYENR